MVTILDPGGGFSSVRITMGGPYSLVPVGATLTPLDLVLVVVGGRLLLQLPEPRDELVTSRLRHLGGLVNVELSSHDEFNCS